MDKNKKIGGQRLRRSYRVRNKLRGTADSPRLCIHRSLKHFGCQVVDDETGNTLLSVSSRDKDVRGALPVGGNCESAAAIGKLLAEKAVQAGISRVRLDRGHAKYHGRVKAFADAAREGGLQF
jgi:large subunit ribosomal protein L18